LVGDFQVLAQDVDSLLFPPEKPSNYSDSVGYDGASGTYNVQGGIGGVYLDPPSVMDLDEYKKYNQEAILNKNWRDLANSRDTDYGLGKNKNSKLKKLAKEQFDNLIPEYKLIKENIGKIFGDDAKFDMKLQGSVELDFQFRHTYRDDKSIPEEIRGNTTFKMDNDIQVNATGSIGDKLNLNTDFLTKSLFGRRNEVNLTYEGEEDEIIKLVQLGNVNMPLPGTLITGSQDLFGVKTQLQFGPTKVTAVISEQRTESKSIQVENGGQKTRFEFYADNYDDNRHFFVDPYFYNNYDKSLEQMPFVNSLVQITKMEVWITNTRANVDDLRDVFALTDVGGDGSILPDNKNNNLNPQDLVAANGDFRVFSNLNSAASSQGLKILKDYEKIEKARKLQPNEYTFHPQLGYVSLNRKLNDGEVLAVAFQYTYNGEVKQVGEFSDQLLSPNTLMLKLVKPTILDISHPTWKLMMKNIYRLDAYQVDREDFELNVLYKQPSSGTKLRYLPEDGMKKKQLIEVLNLDNLNANGDQGRDGFFDFIDNPPLTVDPSKGRIIFPMVEPFGSYIKNKILELTTLTSEQADAYAFDELYSGTQNDAQQKPEKNRFIIQGAYKSQFGSEITIQGAFNLKKGSVVVKQGSEKLVEGKDFIVDYNVGRVSIINESKLNSGTPITISVESESIALNTKRFIGLRVDHQVNDKLVLGGSFVSLRETPLTNKVNFGQEPLNNSIWGIDGTYQTEVPALTRLVDKLPFYETTAKSNIFVDAEFAQFLPGHPSIIDVDAGGTSYLDDFENGEVKLSILYPYNWRLSSIPLGTDNSGGLFPEAEKYNDIKSGFNRAHLQWFQISDLFYQRTAPANIKDNDVILTDPYQRDIRKTEIFENKDLAANEIDRIRPLNLVFDPTEPGPYNFDVDATDVSKGLTDEGKLADPKTRWGGMMQFINNSDWEASNVEYIEFWMMDPYINQPDHKGGNFYINIGNISEDILQDSRKSFENGLPTPNSTSTIDTTAWGLVSNSQIFTRNFDNTDGAIQDVGYDGMNDEQEANFAPVAGDIKLPYLKRLSQKIDDNGVYFQKRYNDPANDNYIHFLGSQWDDKNADIITRYSQYNGMENNTFNDYIGNGSTVPDLEDIDRNNTLNETQGYYQYKVSLDPDSMTLDHPYIVQKKENKGPLNNTDWYLFRIPIRNYHQKFGNVSDFKSIRFLRFFLHGFEEEVKLRFATLSTVRGNWRQLDNIVDETDKEAPSASFQISSVNIEEHANKEPIPYVLPPGITRELIAGANSRLIQNEQSLSLRVCDLPEGKSKATYRNFGVNLNNYKNLQMFVHAEELNGLPLNDGDVSVYVRLGSDYQENYYEYEIPLEITKGATSDPEAIWPSKNRLNIELQKLIELKLERNKKIVSTAGQPDEVSFSKRYKTILNGNNVYIKGNPTLSEVQNVMIGVRNTSNDGDKCAEIWVNELRMSGIEQESSIAFRGQFKTNFADFADLNLSGSYTEAGFGALDQSLRERKFETVRDFSVNTTLQAGKLFPKNWGINLPVYYGITDLKTTPKFNPLDQDVEYQEALDNAPTEELRAQIQNSAETVSKYTNFNVANFSVKPKMKGNPIYNPGNVNLSFSHTKLEERSPTIERNLEERTKAKVAYAYSPKVKPIRPFSKIGFIKKSKLLRPIKELNIGLIPSSFSYSYVVNRTFRENKIRSVRTLGDDSEPFEFDPIFSQSLTMDQNIGIKHDLTKSLKLNLNATTNMVWEGDKLDEPTPQREWVNAALRGDSIRTYHQDFNANYTLPLRYFPVLDFISGRASYKAAYDYIGANSITNRFGNTIQNQRDIQLNAKLDLKKLYKKIPGVKRYYNVKPKKKKKKSLKTSKKLTELKTLNKQDTLKDKNGVNLSPEENEKEKAKLQKSIDKLNKKLKKQREKEKKQAERARKRRKNKDKFNPVETLVKLITSVKKIDGTYTQSRGMDLPGFKHDAERFGSSGSFTQPTLGFMFGQQDRFGTHNENLIDYAGRNKWIVTDFNLNSQYNEIIKEKLNLTARVEPLKRFTINLTANRDYSKRTSFLFKNIHDDPLVTPEFRVLNTNETGQFSMTSFTLNTAFTDADELFNTFLENRKIIADRVAKDYQQQYTPNQSIQYSDEFPVGFNGRSQEVLIPTFLATYSGRNVNSSDLGKFPAIPLPNWNIRYDGLKDIKWLKKSISRLSLSSSYTSKYTISSFQRNLLFDQTNNKFVYGANDNKDLSGNFIPEYQINQVVISEKLTPLKIDLKLRSGFSFNTEYKTSRDISLNIDNSQMLERNTYSYVIGAGYSINDVKLFKGGLGKSKIPRRMEFKFNLGINQDRSLIRNIYDSASQVSAGRRQFTLSSSIAYTINEFLNGSVYFDRNNSLNFVQASFGTTQSVFGFKIRYTLNQK
jgi:cell surface protein SprA